MRKMLLLLIMTGATQVAAKDAYNWKQFMMGCTQGGGGWTRCATELKNKCNNPKMLSDCDVCYAKRPGMQKHSQCYTHNLQLCKSTGSCISPEFCKKACTLRRDTYKWYMYNYPSADFGSSCDCSNTHIPKGDYDVIELVN
jgi:hypothetical protein